MKRCLSFILTISFAFLALSCTGSDDNTADQTGNKKTSNTSFRQTMWGMTPDEVKSAESGTPISENKDLVLYQEQYLEMPSKMGYVFKDGKLVKGAYLIEETFEDPDDYILRYETIKSSIIKEYGPPSFDNIQWLDEETRSEEETMGKSVCEGKVVYRTEWMEEDSFIVLLLQGADNKCRQGIIFESRENYMLENSQNKPTVEIKPDIE